MTPPTITTGQAAAAAACLIAAVLVLFGVRRLTRWVSARDIKGDDALTVVAALVAAMFGGQGMWGFLRDTLHLPVPLATLGFLLFELVMLVCALRARRNLLADGKPGPESGMLWLFAALAGFFSATHAATWAEAAFRFIVPSIAAWLWHRLMRLEHRQLTGKLSGIHWRVTPERVLVWLRLAEPTARTTQQVSATRSLETLAIAVQRAHAPLFGWAWPARRRVTRALRRAVKDADLDTNPDAQRKLTATLGVLSGTDALIALRPTAPWTATDHDLTGRALRLIEDGGIEINERLRILLGTPPTETPLPRMGRLPDLAYPLPRPFTNPVTPNGADRDADDPTGGDRAGHDEDPDVWATVAATVQRLNNQGVGEARIAGDLKISRHQVRKFLGRDTQPASTTVNGSPIGGRS